MASERVSEAELAALVGHRFPGGAYRIEHWENFLLTEATGRAPLPDALAHPAHLFHVPIAGVGTSIAGLFELGRADSDASVTIDYYDWEYFRRLEEARTYAFEGGIVEYERRVQDNGPVIDSMTFQIDVNEETGEPVARASFRWHFWRFGG